MQFPDFSHELPLWKKGHTVIGIDEVGRGCLAGPVYVAAISLPPEIITTPEKISFPKINDSKKVSPKNREEIYKKITSEKIPFGIGYTTVKDINDLGIVTATQNAAISAVNKLLEQIVSNKLFLLTDALYINGIKNISRETQKAIIGGDGKSKTIAAASIMAKVERDNYMKDLAQNFTHYNWEQNKGYGTKLHREAIKHHGPTEHHRKLFIKKVMNSL